MTDGERIAMARKYPARKSGGVHCELFPGCMELGENATVPVCFKHGCPGRVARDFSAAFARAMTHIPRPETAEENEIEDMRAYLWAAGICAGDAEFAAKQLHRQGFRITKIGEGS